MTEHAHSELGPSSSERWINCPGSVLATRGLPDTTSEYAIEGLAAHGLADMCLNDDAPAERYLGIEINVETESGITPVLVNRDMAFNVQSYLDYVNQFNGDAYYEARVSYDNWIPGGFGTSDHTRIKDGLCRTTDLKFGKGIQVYAEENSQLMLYGLGNYQELEYLYRFDKMVLAIHQPRLDHVDEWETSIDHLLQWVNDVARPAAALALQPGAPFKAGKWCQFCKIKATCKERANAVMQELLDDFEPVGPVGQVDTSDVRQLAALTNDEIAAVLPSLGLIRDWCNNIESHALAEILAGRPVGDYKIVEGRSLRRWTNEETAERALRDTKLKVGEIFNKKLISPAQAEKLLGKDHVILEEHVTKPQGAPKLAPGSDKRPPLVLDAENEFGPTED